MPNTKTNRNRNRGTAKCSSLSLKSKSNESKHNSPIKSAKISKYFARPDAEDSPATSSNCSVSSSDSSISPYKNCLNEIQIKELNTSGADDFKTPVYINLATKIQKNNAIKRPKRKRLKQPQLKEFVGANLSSSNSSDVNPEHLQMAIALSESSYAAENPDKTISQEESRENFKKALEQYGFKYGKNTLKVENKRVPTETKKMQKKSRYYYITPILRLRTEEERASLIASKVSLILAQNTGAAKFINTQFEAPAMFSDYLKDFVATKKLFDINYLDRDSLNQDELFYVADLKIERSARISGSLLKNWSEIAGRDISPNKKEASNLQTFTTESASSIKSPVVRNIFSEGEEPRRASIECGATNTENLTRNSPISKDLGDRIEYVESKDVENISRSNSPLYASVDYSRSISPDLFASYEEDSKVNHSNNATPDKIKADNCYIETYDLTQSLDNAMQSENRKQNSPFKDKTQEYSFKEDSSVTSSDLNISGIAQIDDDDDNKTESELNVTEYLNEILKKRLSHKNSLETIERMNKLKYTQEPENNQNNEKLSQESQESIIISDDELNYSSNFNKNAAQEIKINNKYDLSDSEESDNDHENNSKNEIGMPQVQENEAKLLEDSLNDIFSNSIIMNQLEKRNTMNDGLINTPDNSSKLYIKTQDVTPMTNYDAMDTPKIVRELEKYGLKPLKRKRGAALLKHIYDSTHPLVGPRAESIEDEEENREFKKHKKTADNKQNDDELIFERTQSKRIHSCRIPLQIVWQNFLNSNPGIEENVLLYEPLQLEVIHSMLKEQGFKFNIQDLLTFLDKKCITIRTCQNDHRKKKS